MLKTLEELKTALTPHHHHHIAVVFAHDPVVVDALKEASKYFDMELSLIGDADEIMELFGRHAISRHHVIDELDPVHASKIAMDLINQGVCDILMKGMIDTKYLLKAVVNNEYGIKDKKYLSHVGIVEIPGFNRLLMVTDGAMMIEPSVEEKIGIIENAVELAHRIGYARPKVGLVSSVEKVNPKIKSTTDAEEIVKYYATRKNSFDIGGPYALDNLVSEEAAEHKGIKGVVAGKADIIVVSNLDAGNILYKASVFLANADSAGIILGAKVPIILTSRADNAKAKLNSILLAVVKQNGILASRN